MKKLIALLLVIMAVNTMAQDQKKLMSVIDFINIPSLSNPVLSPDGTKILYTLAESNWDENRQISHIWIIGADGSDAHQLTYGKRGERNPQWSPDGKWISFSTRRDDEKNSQVYLMRSDGGEGKVLTSHKTSVLDYSWTPDGAAIYFLASDPLTKEQKEAKEKNDDVFAYDENYQQVHLWAYSLKKDKEVRITEGDYSIGSYILSHDGKMLVVHRSPNPLYDFYRKSEIWIMDSWGKDPLCLTENEVGESGAELSPDGSLVLFLAGANKDFDTYYNNKLFLTPSNGSGKAILPLENFNYEVSAAQWSSDGKDIYFIANMGSQSQLWQYTLATNTSAQLTEGKHSVGQWDYNPLLNKHLLAVNTIQNPGDIFIYENEKLRKVTRHYDYISNDFFLPSQELISWKGEDGVTVEGLLYLPHDYKKGQRYPLVVQTHGGPASSDKFGFSKSVSRYDAVLCAQGYAVLQPNYRGSTGYGDDFLRDMVGSYFNQSHLDVMKGVDYLIEEGIADPDRMVKMGWSAGGHMTNKIVTFTDRFKAAASGAGAVNWMGMYAQSDVRTYRTPWFGGTPWQEDAPIDVYWDHSPLKDISKVSTPTLVLVGENDVRVPLPQSVEMYRALRSNGVPTHLYVAPREPHGWRELRHRLYKINIELDWFAKYALDKEYIWEKVE